MLKIKNKAPEYSDSAIARVKLQMHQFSGDDCWIWPLSKTKAGYGQLTYRSSGKTYLAYAHRASFYISTGINPDGLHVCHKCDNPSCFNPSHLFLGTAQDNADDRVKKGRGNKGKKLPLGDRHWTKNRREEVRGSNNATAKLDENKVLEILNSPLKNVRMAEKYLVSEAVICSVRKGRTWKHVTQAWLQAHPHSH